MERDRKKAVQLEAERQQEAKEYTRDFRKVSTSKFGIRSIKLKELERRERE
ncbi:Hypothetical protein FKW44_003384 [Caligus rogercresseyi]|uniref:Uncharacterized protein n=1 Tax=Caligus rogercresseyi TaxID=217165 RepID=A0A7T8KLI7_CALRO|nr:Hypothetical protein FKW44_003384 [Caligus rogercresseyi]